MPKLIVVDDEPDICELLSAALIEPGYAVRTCTNGTEAIELFRRERADVVFCDLKLPGLDGLSVLEALKSIDPWVTVIMITGYGSVEVATHALRLGAYDFVEKPFTDGQIKQIANRALEHRRQLKQLALLQGKKIGSAADIPARLVELEQLRHDFLNMVIQDLRTPLGEFNEVLSLAEEGAYGPWADPLKQAFMHEMAKERALLSRLLLESFALFLSHDHRLKVVSTDIRALMEGILKEVQPLCDKKRLRLKTSLPPEPLSGPMDGERLSAVVRELLDNAVQFTPSVGTIEVELARTDKGFRIRVSDSGCGMTDREREWLFTAFRQPRGEKPERRRKLGLGLALVKHYVDLLNGTLDVTSVPGEGSHFVIALPWLSRPEKEPDGGAAVPEKKNAKLRTR